VWSGALDVRTPAAPRDLPATPQAFAARALSPYAAELTWAPPRACADNGAYGFEVLRSAAVNADVRGAFPDRVAILPPGSGRAVVHGLKPGAVYAFRVRSFNPVGTSPPSAEQSVRLPPAGAPAHVSREHISAFVFGVRTTTPDGDGSRDADYYVACPGGTQDVASGSVGGEPATLTPPFGDPCQAWPLGD
jgi:hypothetical protein